MHAKRAAFFILGDGLDGTFLDSIDWFLTFGCGGRWVCTDAEKQGLVAGSLRALDASLAFAASKGKLLSVSSHNSLAVNADFYLAQLDMIARHGNAWRCESARVCACSRALLRAPAHLPCARARVRAPQSTRALI